MTVQCIYSSKKCCKDKKLRVKPRACVAVEARKAEYEEPRSCDSISPEEFYTRRFHFFAEMLYRVPATAEGAKMEGGKEARKASAQKERRGWKGKERRKK